MFKLALVTGASSGLGKALAQLLASHKIPLLITGRDAGRLEELAASLRSQVDVIFHAADLCNPAERIKLIELIRKHVPDLVINNAGCGLYGDALMHSIEEQMQILELNANALLEISLEAARALIQHQKKGTILNVSSSAAFFTYPSFNVYAASKAFVLQFSLAFDKEVSSHGVRVLTTCPGQIETSFRKRASKNFTQRRDLRTMSADKAAELLFEQIQKQKTLSIIDWRYKILTFIARFCLPKALIQKILRNAISSRHQ